MWLLEQSMLKQIEAAAGFIPTADDVARFDARMGGDGPRGLSIVGNVADISIVGVLTKRLSLMAMLFGGGNTTYTDIIANLDRAVADPAVTQINLLIESPGGSADGLFNTIAAIQAARAKKPVVAYVDGLAASAAYIIAAQAERITLSDQGARVGSIGVVASVGVNPSTVELTSTDAPGKRPNVQTAEGRAMIIGELDALHTLFAESIATGRGVTVKKVNEKFGRGGMLLAGEALKRGMVDAVSGNKTNSQTEIKAMDLATLKAEHPVLFASITKLGADAERDRVTAHLIMGEASGDMKTAVTACRDGSEMTATIKATYDAAAMNRKDAAARAADDAATAKALADAATAAPVTSTADAVADLVEQSLGLK